MGTDPVKRARAKRGLHRYTGQGMVRGLIVRAYHRLKPWLESLENQESAAGGPAVASGVSHFPTFLCRLMEELARAERHHLELGLLVFSLPLSAARGPQRTELEVVLRDCLRKSDIPGRLSDDLLAVLLPETGQRAPEAAERIARLLSQTAGTAVTAGYARYPQDGQRVSQLLAVATERSTGTAAPEAMARGAGLEGSMREIPKAW
jgi:diguanylate cyclase with GGDEF domain